MSKKEPVMHENASHPWEFQQRLLPGSYGRDSRLAARDVKAAVAEIKKVARKEARLGAEGALLFLEVVSPAIASVNGSSGAIGSTTEKAVKTLVAIFADAPLETEVREAWLERIWVAYLKDTVPYIESLADYWGELCKSKALASTWADRLLEESRDAWGPDPATYRFFRGTKVCLSALEHAERYEDILDLLGRAPFSMWYFSQHGVRALAALGRVDEALHYAIEHRGLNGDPIAMARTCEEVLRNAGRVDEAYERFGLEAHKAHTNLAWFKAVVKTYPHKSQAEVLADLVALTPGREGSWFAAACSAGFYDEALQLARQSPCAPQTLTRAARDMEAKRPEFAREAGMAALHVLVEGAYYSVTGDDVKAAYTHTMKAAEHLGEAESTRERIRELVAGESTEDRFITRVLGRTLGLR